MPAIYYDYLDMFSKAKSDRLLPLRVGVDYKIELTLGLVLEDLNFSLLYKLSLDKLEAYR